MKEDRNTNWNLIIQAHLSLDWCHRAMDPKHKDKTVGQLRDDFKKEYEGVEPLNVGTLIMAAYPLFVYPEQTEFEKIDFSKINTSRFTVLTDPTADGKNLCRRIRNALAHGNFKIVEGQIVEGQIVEDQIEFIDYEIHKKSKQKINHFKATIATRDFGNFINNFMFTVKQQFQSRNANQ